MSSLLSAETQVRDVDSLAKARLGWRVKQGIERDVLEHFVHSEFVRIGYHD